MFFESQQHGCPLGVNLTGTKVVNRVTKISTAVSLVTLLHCRASRRRGSSPDRSPLPHFYPHSLSPFPVHIFSCPVGLKVKKKKQGFRQTHTHVACWVHHGSAPVHGLLGAGSHRLRPAVVELASRCRLITTSRPERNERRHFNSLRRLQTSTFLFAVKLNAGSVLRVLPKVGKLHRQLNENVWVQLPLFDGCFPKCREGVADQLQVLCL